MRCKAILPWFFMTEISMEMKKICLEILLYQEDFGNIQNSEQIFCFYNLLVWKTMKCTGNNFYFVLLIVCKYV